MSYSIDIINYLSVSPTYLPGEVISLTNCLILFMEAFFENSQKFYFKAG